MVKEREKKPAGHEKAKRNIFFPSDILVLLISPTMKQKKFSYLIIPYFDDISSYLCQELDAVEIRVADNSC